MSISHDRDKKIQSLEPFKEFGDKKSPLHKGLSHSQNKPHGGGRYYYTTIILTNIIINVVNMVNSGVPFKIRSKGNFNMEVRQHKENTSFTNNSKLVPLDFDASSSKKVIY